MTYDKYDVYFKILDAMFNSDDELGRCKREDIKKKVSVSTYMFNKCFHELHECKFIFEMHWRWNILDKGIELHDALLEIRRLMKV